MSWLAIGLIPSAGPTGAELAGPFDLGRQVQLARLPAELGNLRGPGLTWEQLQLLVPAVEYVLLCPYELDVDPGRIFTSRQEEINERLLLANLAVWLVSPNTNLRFRYIIHLRVGRSVELVFLRPGPPLYHAPPSEPTTVAHLQEARVLNEAIGSLPRHGPVWIAIRTLWGALTERWFHNRYALLWTALEALFGPQEGDAVTFRVSQNLSFFLADTAEQRQVLFREAKKAYGKRSKVVHGEYQGVQEAEFPKLVHEAESWLRSALTTILGSGAYLEAFSTSQARDAFMERLVLGLDGSAGGPGGDDGPQ
jgi:hypothetical protein